jgi:MoxR-like ATPase
LDFRRIQFTVDMLPSDIVGSEVVDQKTGAWLARDGARQGQCTHLARGPDRQFAASLQETAP